MEKKKKIKEERGGGGQTKYPLLHANHQVLLLNQITMNKILFFQKKVRIISKAKVSRWELPEDMAILSASFLISLTVTGRTLVYSSTDFGAYPANESNQNLVKDISGVSFRLIVPFVFFLILTFVLQRVTLKQFLLVPTLPCSQPTKFGLVIHSTFWDVHCSPVHPE